MAYKNIEDQRAASKRHYQANKKIYLERNKRYRQQIVDFVNKIKEDSPCSDCGEYHPAYVMDFDHLESTQKTNIVSILTATGRIGALKREILKCELVCSNCHRVRTHTRLKKPVE